MEFMTNRGSLNTVGEMKREAKAQLEGRWMNAVFLCLVPSLIVIIGVMISVVLSILFAETGAGSEEASFTFVIDFIQSFIFIGITYTFIDMIRRDDYQIMPLRDAFQIFTQKYFLGNLIITVLVSIYTFLWALLFVIPGIIKIYSYSQAYYIYKDLADQGAKPSANECITESRKLMNGYKFQLFTLELSFIGWHILSILLLGIPYLWVFPYLETTKAVFYQNLLKEQQGDFEYTEEWEESFNSYEDYADDEEFTDF